MFIPDVKIHTGHRVGVLKFSLFKVLFQRNKKKEKSNQILFLLKNIPSCFLFGQNAGILQQIYCRLAKEIHANAGAIHYVHELRRSLNQLVQSELFSRTIAFQNQIKGLILA